MTTGGAQSNWSEGEAPERGTIAELVALGGLVRRAARCALRAGYRCVAAITHAKRALLRSLSDRFAVRPFLSRIRSNDFFALLTEGPLVTLAE